MKKPRTVAIVEARMGLGSSRLPGKVMMKIGGRPLLVYLVERVSKARTLDAIVIATTTNPLDNVIIEECERRGIPNFRGSEMDVLSRCVSAARACVADIVVRVTANNPFTDPDSIDRVVDVIVSTEVDYAVEMNLPVGTTGEALTWKSLRFIDSIADTPRWREDVTLYPRENPHALNCAFLNPRPGCNRPDLSFTVDELHEYLFSREIAGALNTIDFELKNLIQVADEVPVRTVAGARDKVVRETVRFGIQTPAEEFGGFDGPGVGS